MFNFVSALFLVVVSAVSSEVLSTSKTLRKNPQRKASNNTTDFEDRVFHDEPYGLISAPKIIIFTDSDFDDTQAITFALLQQALYGQIKVEAIVVDDGFLSRDQGLQWLYYWITSTFPQLAIPLVRGYPRDTFLASTRFFVPEWIESYTTLLSENYPGYNTTTPIFTEMDEWIENTDLLTDTAPLHTLEIAPINSLDIILLRFPQLRTRISTNYYDGGNLGDTAKIYPDFPNANTTVDTDWNSFLNPDGLATLTFTLANCPGRFVFTTKTCTESSVLNASVVAAMENYATVAYIPETTNKETLVLYNATLSFLSNIVVGSGSQVGTAGSWDLATLFLLLGVPLGQDGIFSMPFTTLWTGKVVNSTLVCPGLDCLTSRVASFYTSMEAEQFFQRYIDLIFLPLSNVTGGKDESCTFPRQCLF